MDKDAAYDALVKEALEKLDAKYKQLPARPAERVILEKIHWADDGQLQKVLEVLEGG